MTFRCAHPDFSVRSIIDDQVFPVSRKALCTSEVFCNMFSCCDDSTSEKSEQSLDLAENSASLSLLLTLLHSPPELPIQSNHKSWDLPASLDTDSSVIPLPILPQLFSLADKYALPDSVTKALCGHLLVHAPTNPLFVYGFAVSAGFSDVASKSCRWLKPMASYSKEEIEMIPTVEAYHKVIRLQDARVKTLKRMLLEEEIFPHGYGACPSHLNETKAIWHAARINLARKIETLTDVAGEMEDLLSERPIRDCTACRKACTAAVEMLRYKCRKAPRTFRHLQNSES
ncbi:hypothetical protein K435DRAFT_959647 [Dendrothele bispora CBS 962.96]|uniref:BTB domain-containing protein n=1 Tax=Dendrothele bispora (strain CBS 962.96) TaxID=1314807 RepID=A0A4S8MW77_DENBC|nr:hypothetical protein K435DRAFT_959647 [Dendrothele bispora CBS 962.96]